MERATQRKRIMKVIFLDMDGVLNNRQFLVSLGNPRSYEHDWLIDSCDNEAVKRLNSIVEATGAKVVISSSWRLMRGKDSMQNILNASGFKGEVIGCTPTRYDLQDAKKEEKRGTYIKKWISDQKTYKPNELFELEAFAILDDLDPSNFEGLEEYHVHTSYESGLLDNHIEQAIEILKR
jgi:hypothetical protein